MKTIHVIFISIMTGLLSCSAGKTDRDQDTAAEYEPETATVVFDADSAYAFVEKMVAFGPRVPNTEAHRLGGDWIVGKLKEYGWDVVEQKASLTAFDGTVLQARNIFAQINPENKDRLLLLTHWDCRPWADEDTDEAKRSQPVDGANDGASGVGVLLEVARQLSADSGGKGVDLLFVDAEDWGDSGDEESWAMGTRYFTEHWPVKGYRPKEAILLDMVGSPDARFGFEYFSVKSNPELLRKVWYSAEQLGHGKYFHRGFGGAVTDDHIQLIEHGIPAIDIIDYRGDGYGQGGFDPVWHTTHDGMQNISRETLKAVGETVLHSIGRD